VKLHWSVANTILIAHRTGSHLRKKGDKVEGSHLKSYYQHQKRDFFRRSRHKSLGTSSKGEMRTEKGKTRLVDFQRVLHQNPHNSHGSCCSCTNSQGTRLQHPPMGPFFFPDSPPRPPNTIHGGEIHCRLGPLVSLPFTSPATSGNPCLQGTDGFS